MSTTAKTREGHAPADGPTASELARLRHQPWYRRPRWTRLTAIVGLALLLNVMSGPQGSREDVFFSLEETLASLRLLYWLLAAAALWAVLEFRGSLAHAARVVFAPVGRALGPVFRPVARVLAPVTRPVAATARAVWPRLRAPGADIATARRVVWGNIWLRLGLISLVLAGLVILPQLISTFWNQVLVNEVAVYVLLAIGLNVVVGWAGLLDLGFIAFFAIGAYSAAYWTGAMPVEPPFELNPFLVIPVAVATCLLAGVLLGAPTLRLRGDYLAIVTLGFHEIIYLIARNAEGFTNGPRGVQGIPYPSIDLGTIDLGGFELRLKYDWELDPVPYWYLLIAIVAVLVIAFNRLEHSRVGRAWTAIREDEVAAASSGVPTVKYKLMAFAIGASTSGVAGVVYATKSAFISPESFLLIFSVLVVAYVIFGGMGSLWGVILGTAFLAWLPQYLKDQVDPRDRFMYLGALLIVMMIYRPQGLIPSTRRRRELVLAREGTGDADAMTEPAGGRIT